MNPSGFTPRFPFAHTFSVIARDVATGQMGVAVQSHWFSVGSVVPWAEAGVGAIATQAMAEISYGPLGLTLLRAGKSAAETLNALLSTDSGRELRQVAMVDTHGSVATHTGKRCMDFAGHFTGEGFSVQANMMSNATIWGAMAEAYRATQGDFAERLLATLEAAQQAGGDVRGQQSAAMLIVPAQPSGKPWQDRLVDLRVEDSLQPIVELRRLVRVQRAYQFMNEGDAHLGEGRIDEALRCYTTADELAPEMDELPFWHATTLADMGRVDEALPIFRRVFELNPNWAELLKRLPPVGLLRDNPEMMAKILAECT